MFTTGYFIKFFSHKPLRVSVYFILYIASQFGPDTFHVFSNHTKLAATLLGSIALKVLAARLQGGTDFHSSLLFPCLNLWKIENQAMKSIFQIHLPPYGMSFFQVLCSLANTQQRCWALGESGRLQTFLFLSVTRSSSRRVLCNFGITKTTY